MSALAKQQFQTLFFLSVGAWRDKKKAAGRRHLWSLENRVWGQINILVALPMRSPLYGAMAHFNDRKILGLMKKFMCIAHSRR
jgi:hypothetical protein